MTDPNGADWRQISRDGVWQEFLMRPESRPADRSGVSWGSSYTRKEYSFAVQWRTEAGATAGEMSDLALTAAKPPPHGLPAIWPWMLLLISGLVFGGIVLFVYPPLALLALAAMWLAMVRTRRATDARYGAQYHRRFAEDVENYARAIATR